MMPKLPLGNKTLSSDSITTTLDEDDDWDNQRGVRYIKDVVHDLSKTLSFKAPITLYALVCKRSNFNLVM
jgi:hypothetical protein